MSLESPGIRLPEEMFKSDFYLRFYDTQKPEFSKIENDVRAFFGEKLFQPRDEKVFIGRDGTLDPNYVEVMQHAIDYWRERGDEKASNRFVKELEGAKNAVKLILQSNERGSRLPIIINASDPGDFYVDEEGNKKSVTFVWTLEAEESGGWRYHVFSLPTAHIGLENHWKLLKDLGDLQLTERILRHILTDLDAGSLIAFPVILDQLNNNLDSIAIKLGYQSWDKVEELSSNQLALEKDGTAQDRRERIVTNFTFRIWHAVKQQKSQKYQEALVAAMSDTMAVEAGKRAYLGMNSEEIDLEIKKNVQLSLAIHHDVFKKNNYQEVRNLGFRFYDLSNIYAHAVWMNREFNSNADARQARSTGCGGSGNDYGLNAWGNIELGNYSRTVFAEQRNYEGKFGSLNEYGSSSGGEPDGKYSGADYKPGKCVACGKERQKVWHSKDGGCGCCTTCEQELSGGE